jgi:tetratricopeptide (TPR) repeat protein
MDKDLLNIKEMKNIVYILTMLLMATSFGGCKKYLDEKPTTSVVVPSTLQDLQALLDDNIFMNQRMTPGFGEASADDYFLLVTDFNSRNTWNQNAYRWITDANYVYANDWSAGYSPVYNANYCLEQIQKIELNSTNRAAWENVKGSALFHRAYCFLNLVWTFSKAYDAQTAGTDAGIPLRSSSDFNVPSVRASVKACYEKIISDTKDAAELLPDHPAHVMRPSKAAAYGLLARTYLSMRNYEEAFKYADLGLQLKNQLMNLNGDQDFLGAAANLPFRKFNKETIFYTEMTLSLSIISPSFAKIDTALYSIYASNDIRRVAYFSKVGNYQKFKGTYSSVTNVHFSGIAVDELFLIRAECHARKGDKTAALADLNTLLTKRYNATFVPVTATDANDALGKILVERRKELLMRGLRFIDVKRLNKEGTGIVLKRVMNGEIYTIAPNDNRYALPLPQEIVNQGIPQNIY